MTPVQDPLIWLFAFGTAYLAVLLFWARAAASEGAAAVSFLSPQRAVAPFIVAMAVGAVSFAPLLAMNLADGVSSQGFGYGAVALAGITIPLTGALFFKRIWALSVRFGPASQARFFEDFYGSKTLAVLSAGVALLFAIPFGGRLLAQFADMFNALSGGSFSPIYSLALLALMLIASTVVGGLRGVLYLGAIQGVLGAAGVAGVIAVSIYLAGGYTALAASLVAVQSAGAEKAGLFAVEGVIQFTRGLGIDLPSGSSWTAMMVFSTVLGFMGLQAAPAVHQLVIASRSTRGIAAGQTWVTATVFGGLALALALVLGGYGLGRGGGAALAGVMGALAAQSPWIMAALYFCLLSIAFVFVGASHFAAAHILVCDIYKRNFHKGLDDATAAVLVRIVIAVLIVVSAIFAASLPGAAASLSALAMPLSFQLVPALIGICFSRFITRQAVATGVVIGMVCVLLTEDAGHWGLQFVGLKLPWGRWPWTLHSAAWGIFFNLLAVLVISIITQRREQTAMWRSKTEFVRGVLQGSPRVALLWSTAWSVVLAWMFLAIGPGLVMGNAAFVRTTDAGTSNILGLPSLIVWIMIGWVTGVVMIWFLSYRMELATPVATPVEAADAGYRMPERHPGMNTDRLSALVWILLAIGGGIALLSWLFGR